MKSKYVALIVVAVLGMVSVPSRSKAQEPSDPQIVGIVIAADDIDINYAKIALKKSKEKGVRDFAQQMVTDHSAVQKSVRELAGCGKNVLSQQFLGWFESFGSFGVFRVSEA